MSEDDPTINELKEKLSEIIELMEAGNFISDLEKKLEKEGPKPLFGEKKEGIYKPSDLLEVKHPVLRRKEFLDPGNLKKKLNEIDQRAIIDAVSSGSLKTALDSAEKFLDEVKKRTVDFMLAKVKEGDDLRPMMMPGSVGRNEIPNLYLRKESYSRADRVRLTLQLVKSIGIGSSASVYFEGDFQDFLENLIRKKFNKGYNYLEARDLKAGEREMSQPFVLLLRLLIWIYEQLKEVDENIEKLKSSSGIIYFVPEDSERYNAFRFPQLNRFIETWLKDDSRREALKSMLDSIASSSRRDIAEVEVDLIYHNLNLLAYSLIETCSVDWGSLRRILDSLITLSDKRDLRINLGFVRKLGEAYESLR
ncbi:MAG: hypothetical protein NZ992_00280 [Candidatus Korarchaeum sp.]|nr:hypothetical protein [Candidatus Korarchaeum sp.]MDW8035249.1 hypothetical protein [Candidatus Korarchaeum sp.]